MTLLHLLIRAGSVGRMVVGELCGRKQTPDLWSPPPWVALQTLNMTHVASPGHTPHPLPPVDSHMSTAPPQKPKTGASADPQCSVQLNTGLFVSQMCVHGKVSLLGGGSQQCLKHQGACWMRNGRFWAVAP